MSEYVPGSADRAAFFLALGRVFQEFQEVGKGYAICEIDRLATVAGVELGGHVGVSRVEGGSIVTTFELFPPPSTIDINDCFAVVPDFTTDPPSWECIMYLTA